MGNWVTHMTGNLSTAAEQLGEAHYPGQTTLTSMALAEAQNELIQGREGATPVILVITDGKPMFETRTREMAETVKGSARLMFVPVGDAVKSSIDNMYSWASE